MKLRRNPPIIALLLVLIIGFGSRDRLLSGPSKGILPNRAPTSCLSDRHKELIHAQGDLSKWLLGLASGTLAALLGLVFKEPERGDLLNIMPMTAYGLLLLSLYGAFLYYEATAQILRLGPLDYFFADQYRFP